MADKIEFSWNKQALGQVIGTAPETLAELDKATQRILANAQGMSAGFKTGIWHDHATGEKRGNTQAKYAGDVKRMGSSYVGIVYTANYAAQKDNLKNNTLLKVL